MRDDFNWKLLLKNSFQIIIGNSGSSARCRWSTRKCWSSPKCRGPSSRCRAWRHRRRAERKLKRWRHHRPRTRKGKKKGRTRSNRPITWSHGRWTAAGWRATCTLTPPLWRCRCGRRRCTTSRWIWWVHQRTSAAPRWPSTPTKRLWWRQSNARSRQRHSSMWWPVAEWRQRSA